MHRLLKTAKEKFPINILIALIIGIILGYFIGTYISGNVGGQAVATGSILCKDSDNGRNYNVAGAVMYVGKGIAAKTITLKDECMFNSGVLVEYYCSGKNPLSVNYKCPYGCFNGACKSAPVVACKNFTYSAWSSCVNGNQGRTLATKIPTGCTGGAVPVLSQKCQVCGNNKIEGSEKCDGTDFGTELKNYIIQNSQSSTCAAYSRVQYGFGPNGVPYSAGDVRCRADCTDYNLSKCSIPVVVLPTCTKTDDSAKSKIAPSNVAPFVEVDSYGYDIYTAGTVYMSNLPDNAFPDYCPSNTDLLEKYCQTPHSYAVVPVHCDYGCENGACKAAPTGNSTV